VALEMFTEFLVGDSYSRRQSRIPNGRFEDNINVGLDKVGCDSFE
jgi:hypothetical protein